MLHDRHGGAGPGSAAEPAWIEARARTVCLPGLGEAGEVGERMKGAMI